MFTIKQDGDVYKVVNIEDRIVVATCSDLDIARFIVSALTKAAQQGVNPTGYPTCEICGSTNGIHDMGVHLPD